MHGAFKRHPLGAVPSLQHISQAGLRGSRQGAVTGDTEAPDLDVGEEVPANRVALKLDPVARMEHHSRWNIAREDTAGGILQEEVRSQQGRLGDDAA